jgi:hypothetical protein
MTSACCSKIADTEAVVSVNEKKLLEMHMYMHVQLMQYELRAPQTLGSLTMGHGTCLRVCKGACKSVYTLSTLL